MRTFAPDTFANSLNEQVSDASDCVKYDTWPCKLTRNYIFIQVCVIMWSNRHRGFRCKWNCLRWSVGQWLMGK